MAFPFQLVFSAHTPLVYLKKGGERSSLERKEFQGPVS
jgi:hypothetical protein